MSVSVEVQYGTCVLVDRPSYGQRKHGVAPGGPFDSFCADLANGLVCNPAGAAVLEFASAQARVTASAPVWVGLAGSGHLAELDGKRLPLGSRFLVPAGGTLDLRPVAQGLRCHLSCPGGWSPTGLSASGYRPRSDSVFNHMVRVSFALPSLRGGPVRVVQANGLDERGAVVTARIDRVGLRLRGREARTGEQAQASRPTVFGAVQRTPDGELLIHGPDGPTLGGYDLLGVVATADLDRLAQLRPGDTVEFEAIDVVSARRLWERETTDRRRLLDHVLNLAGGP